MESSISTPVDDVLGTDAKRIAAIFDMFAIGAILVGAVGVLGFLGAANAASSDYEPTWPYLVLALTTAVSTPLVWAGLKLSSLIARHIGQRH